MVKQPISTGSYYDAGGRKIQLTPADDLFAVDEPGDRRSKIRSAETRIAESCPPPGRGAGKSASHVLSLSFRILSFRLPHRVPFPLPFPSHMCRLFSFLAILVFVNWWGEHPLENWETDNDLMAMEKPNRYLSPQFDDFPMI